MVDVGDVTPGVGAFLAVVTVVAAEDAGLGLGVPALVELVKVEVRRAAVLRVEDLRFSSSDAEGWDLCAEAAVAGLLATVEPAGGRVGGLVKPPLAAAPVRVAELAVGLVRLEEVVPGRRAAGAPTVEVLFAAVVVPAGFEPLAVAAAGFFTGGAPAPSAAAEGSAGGASTAGASAAGASAAGASAGGGD